MNNVYEIQIEILEQVKAFLVDLENKNQEDLQSYRKLIDQLSTEGLDSGTLNVIASYYHVAKMRLQILSEIHNNEHLPFVDQITEYLNSRNF